MVTSSTVRVLLAVSMAPAALAGCSFTTEGELQTFAGEWCTLRGLGTGSLPVAAERYVGMTLFEDAGTLAGSGPTKRKGSDVIHQSRFRGTYTGDLARIDVSDLDPLAEDKGPVLTLELRLSGPRDLVGTISGDALMDGPITLVRLGPRCFVE